MSNFVEKLSAARRVGGVSLLLTFLALAIHWLPPSWTLALQYDRDRVGAGELHRLITCHWTHWSFDHLLWDAGTFLLLGIVCERRSPRRFGLTILITTILVPVSVHLLLPALGTYRGLSALDSSLFALLAVSLFIQNLRAGKKTGIVTTLVFVVGFVAKTMIEMEGFTVFADSTGSDFIPVPIAHLVGFMVGGLVAVTPLFSAPRAGRLNERGLSAPVV